LYYIYYYYGGIFMNTIPKTLTIAGSDSSGGAGLQADLKTFEEYGTYGLTAITSIVTMDPDNGWSHGVTAIDPLLLKQQIKTATAGGEIAAMKTGMLPNVEIIKIVKETLENGDIKNIVIDPVMVCKGEAEVLNPENADALRDMLIPLATVATPNLFEAGVLSGMGKLKGLEDMKEAAVKICALGAKSVVIKGGKSLENGDAIDLFYDGKEFEVFSLPKLPTNNNHGAGCTFAAAVAAGLATGLSVRDAVCKAKDFAYAAIKHGFAFNQYVGPVYHAAYRLCK
jgi:pyridoxine kinase